MTDWAQRPGKNASRIDQDESDYESLSTSELANAKRIQC